MTSYENQAPPLPPKPKFSLSKSNQIFLIIIAILLYAVVILKVTDGQAEAGAMGAAVGRATGRLIAFALIPSFFAWIVWFIARKNSMASSWTFNIVLGLMVLIVISSALKSSNDIKQNQAAKQFAKKTQQSITDFKDKAINADDPEESQAAYNELANSAKSSFKNLANSGSKEQRQFFNILLTFTKDMQAKTLKWQNTLKSTQTSDMLDFTRLNNNTEYERQKKIIQNYIAETKSYKKSLTQALPELKKRLRALGNNSFAKGALQRASKKHHAQKPFTEPLIDTHIEYGNNMIQLLEFLQTNQGKWSFENNQMLFLQEGLFTQFNQLAQKMLENETKINTLSDKLIETL